MRRKEVYRTRIYLSMTGTIFAVLSSNDFILDSFLNY